LLQLCIDKARAELGWCPVWDFPTTVDRTVAWYRRALQTQTPREVRECCLEDIKAYEEEAAGKQLEWTRTQGKDAGAGPPSDGAYSPVMPPLTGAAGAACGR
jgi:hypothetical protein